MTIKRTIVRTRPSTDVNWLPPKDANWNLLNINTWPGYIDITRTVSEDGLTLTSVELWEDGYPNKDTLTADQLYQRQKVEEWSGQNGIQVVSFSQETIE